MSNRKRRGREEAVSTSAATRGRDFGSENSPLPIRPSDETINSLVYVRSVVD